MEHRGVEYRIIQGIKRGFWKWSVETETERNSGTSDSRDAVSEEGEIVAGIVNWKTASPKRILGHVRIRSSIL
jgi:hypothetical protein